MYASNSYTIRIATADDAEALRRLAALDSKAPLEGTVLVGEIAGRAAAAVSLTDDRAIGEPFLPTAHLLATLRLRAHALHAVEQTPSLRERLIAGLPLRYRVTTAGRAA
jgi:hypothetical protein